jgi:PPOX class probable F420-dependent enzyme
VDEATMPSRLADARVGRLATADAEGAPHLVPCCFALDGDTVYSAVDGKPKSTRALRRLENIRANPQVEVLVDHYEEDWSRLWWVRLRGTARVTELHERALELLQAKYEQYRRAPPAGPLIEIAVALRIEWPRQAD